MPDNKRIALFLDGTWNTVENNTNVWRLKSLCANDASQVSYYSAGVGTQFGDRLRGGLFGYGLDQEVILAYEWLVENYNPGDRIYLFGFSRGAFTARSLSGAISKCGLLKPGAPISMTQLYDRYRKGAAARTIREIQNVPDAELTVEETWLKKYSQPIPIWFQGLWDTVGALGIPFGDIPILSRSNYAFLEVDLRINNDWSYHALAIDEHREAFAPTLWVKSVKSGVPTYPPRTLDAVEQRWFVGAHADVGGGYADGLLAQVPLLWLMQKAQLRGVLFGNTVTIDGNENKAAIHDSFAEMAGGLYRILKFWRPYYRTIGADPVTVGETTTTTINETIDASVFDRWHQDPTYRPRNLADWVQRRHVDIATLKDSVRAEDPTVIVPPIVLPIS